MVQLLDNVFVCLFLIHTSHTRHSTPPLYYLHLHYSASSIHHLTYSTSRAALLSSMTSLVSWTNYYSILSAYSCLKKNNWLFSLLHPYTLYSIFHIIPRPIIFFDYLDPSTSTSTTLHHHPSASSVLPYFFIYSKIKRDCLYFTSVKP